MTTIVFEGDGDKFVNVDGPQYVRAYRSFGTGTIAFFESNELDDQFDASTDGTAVITMDAPQSKQFRWGYNTRLKLTLTGSTAPTVRVLFEPLSAERGIDRFFKKDS